VTEVQAVLATSSNGVRAFAGRCGRKDIRVFAVGGNTAATARSAGFTHVSRAEGDSAALAAAICRSLNPDAGALLHVTGKIRSNELQRELAEAGFECRVWELYDVIACRRLPEQVITAFKTDAVDAVLVLSPESGRILVEALKTGGVTPKCDRVVACCISTAAAVKIRDVEFGAIRIAEKPTLDATLALLDFRARRAE
jgi:uroporphyrinogen-III synthase